MSSAPLAPVAWAGLAGCPRRRALYASAFPGPPFSASAATIGIAKWIGMVTGATAIGLILRNSMVAHSPSRLDRFGIGFVILSMGAVVLATLGRGKLAAGSVPAMVLLIQQGLATRAGGRENHSDSGSMEWADRAIL